LSQCGLKRFRAIQIESRGGVRWVSRGNRHTLVFGNRFSREAVKYSPGHVHPDFATPTQELEVSQAGGSLPHQSEDDITEAFDAGLNVFHAARK
jgi:hypothetical protein